MPQRSNDFQRLIATITELLGDGATVTESKMLRELDSDRLREVDICIDGMLAGQPVMIGIECRNHRRKQTVEFVEAMQAKHASLPTDLVILVSSSGFTETALEKARKANIKAIAPSRVTPDLAHEIVAALRFRLTAMTAQVTAANISLAWPKEWEAEELLPFDPDLPLYGPDLRPLITIGAYSNEVMVRHLMLKRANGTGRPPDTEFTVAVDRPRYLDQDLHACVILADTPLLSTDPNPGRLLPVRRFTVTAKWSVTGTTNAKFTEAGTYDEVNYWAGKSQAGPALSQFVVVDRPPGIAGSVSFGIGAPKASGR
jgi:hypothetical protein